MSIEAARHGRVLHIALNRPAKRNALNGELCQALVTAIDEADADPQIGSVLLSGKGPAFCAGMDLSETGDFAALHERLFTMIDRVRKPIIAAVQGPALAGGTGLAANAHIVVAGPEGRFGLTEIRIGLWPVLVFRAVSLAIGERRATELSITGRIVSAEEARTWGLVTEIHEDPLKRALETATTAAGWSANAMRRGLEYVHDIRTLNWAAAGRLGETTRAAMLSHEDFRAAVKSFRKPEAQITAGSRPEGER
jgi:enoyl-CoA hydratase/carnithine racemase